MDKKNNRFLAVLFAISTAASFALTNFIARRPPAEEAADIVSRTAASIETTTTSSTTTIPDTAYELEEAKDALRAHIISAESEEKDRSYAFGNKAFSSLIPEPERDEYGDSKSEQERYRRDMRKFYKRKIDYLEGAQKYVANLELSENRSTIYDAMMAAMEGYSTMEELRLMEKALGDVSSARNAGEFRAAIPSTMITDELSFTLDKSALAMDMARFLYDFDIKWAKYRKSLGGADIDDTDYRVIRMDAVDFTRISSITSEEGIAKARESLAEMQEKARELMSGLGTHSRNGGR